MRLGRRRDADSERPRLERALIDEVVDRGYLDATVAGVCRRAGLGEKAFRLQFADLEDGYCQVAERLTVQIFERLLVDFALQRSWSDQIRAAAYAIFDFLDEDRRRGRFMMLEVLSAGERAGRIRDDAMDLLIELIDLGRDQLDDSDGLTRATAEAIAGSVLRRVQVALQDDDRCAHELIPQLMYNVVLPYRGATEALRELTIVPPRAPLAGRPRLPPVERRGEEAERDLQIRRHRVAG
jgi:AcrR family transcriptional regulator